MEKAIRRYWPIFVLPTFLAFILGFIAPFAMGVYLSFCKFTTVTDAKFIGFSNYLKIFTDASFVHALWYTAIFTVVTVVLINVLAFAVALALTQKIRGTNIFRTVFFMPNLIGGIVLGYVWQLIFDGILGKFDLALKLNAKFGFWGLVILICWQQIGYMMIVYIAGLQAIPGSLNEAAMIDGAGSFKVFYHVAIRLSISTILVVFLFSFVFNWNETYTTNIMLGDALELLPGKLALFDNGAASGTGNVVNEANRMAATLMAIAPLLVLYALVQKQFIEGIENTGITGE